MKRGAKDFTSGMLGHLKLLAHKETKEERLGTLPPESDARAMFVANIVCIVFRRESVWKVSMTVRLRPAVRVQFDEEQGILRITLKELPELEEETKVSAATSPQVVVYAVTVGYCLADYTSWR